jgi:hypothetical protein
MVATKDVVEPLTETGAAVVQGPFGVDAATVGEVMPPPIAVDPEPPPPEPEVEATRKKPAEKAEKAEKEETRAPWRG